MFLSKFNRGKYSHQILSKNAEPVKTMRKLASYITWQLRVT